MARPGTAPTSTPATATAGDVTDGVIEYPVAFVDAPDAYYYEAVARLVGLELLVLDRDYQIVGRYQLAEQPDINQEQVLVGKSAGLPLVVRPQAGCGCSGTRKVLK